MHAAAYVIVIIVIVVVIFVVVVVVFVHVVARVRRIINVFRTARRTLLYIIESNEYENITTAYIGLVTFTYIYIFLTCSGGGGDGLWSPRARVCYALTAFVVVLSRIQYNNVRDNNTRNWRAGGRCIFFFLTHTHGATSLTPYASDRVPFLTTLPSFPSFVFNLFPRSRGQRSSPCSNNTRETPRLFRSLYERTHRKLCAFFSAVVVF